MKRLTEEEKDKIAEMYKTKNTIQIAAETGRSLATIRVALIERGVDMNRYHIKATNLHSYPPEEVREYMSSHSVKECEDKFKCRYNTVIKYLQDNGINERISDRKFHNIVDKDEFCEYYAIHSISEVCEHFGISESVAYYTKRHLGAKKKRVSTYRVTRLKNQMCPKNFVDTRRKMIAHLAEKYSSEDIAILLNLTPSRICQILKETING